MKLGARVTPRRIVAALRMRGEVAYARGHVNVPGFETAQALTLKLKALHWVAMKMRKYLVLPVEDYQGRYPSSFWLPTVTMRQYVKKKRQR